MKKVIFKSVLLAMVIACTIVSCTKEEEDDNKVNSISIKAVPNKTEYYLGEATDLTGLVITLTTKSGKTEDVNFSDFESKGISAPHGEILTLFKNPITIRHIATGKFVNQPIVFSKVIDIDNNSYPIAKIGTQLWMAKNLSTTKYRNGDIIGTTTTVLQDLTPETTPKYQWAYNSIEKNADTFGRLYTWYAATDSRNICPTGWHLPSKTEWETLISYLGGKSVAGGKFTSIGIGFSAVAGGYRSDSGQSMSGGSQIFPDSRAVWWYIDEYDNANAYCCRLLLSNYYIERGVSDKKYGFSVRCVKD